MGSKGGTTQQTSSSSGPPPQVMAEYQSLVDRATNVANQPYQPYQGEMVAPLSSQTLQGLGGINSYANSAQPYLGAAGAMTMGASAPVNPQQFQGMGSLQNYMNPYTSSVVDTTQAEMNNQNQQQAQFLNSANISSGAFGGDRAGIGQSILANQQQLAEAPTIAGLNQANYTQAMSNWQNQQGVNLAAQQANAARQMAGAAQLGEIGQSTQQAGLQGSQAQIQAGMIPQQEQQAIDTAAQNMYQTSQAYPFTTTGWLGNIIEGTGGLSGGQSQTTSPGPNSITQGLGAATQGIGLLGSIMSLSDERAKENVEEIGKTYDNQPIYRYNFKGDPRTQIGLIAQEEAFHDPGSVKRIGMGDLLGVDYRGATDEAAERGHFADGGEAEMPPGGVTQGVTQNIQPQQKPQEMSPDQALMFMGDPGARSGMGSFGLMGGTNMHPQPELPLAQPARQSFATGGPTFLGNNGSIGVYTPGFEPGVDQLSPLAGVNEALFGEESAGSKNPYTGIDFDQAEAIGGGQWMPPQTNSPMPDWQNLQNSPQFGSAEASLAGLFGGSGATQPAANSGSGPMPMGGAPMPGAAGKAGATQGGLSRGQLGQIASGFFGGGGGGGAGAGGAGGMGGFDYTPGSVPAGTDTLSQPAPEKAPPSSSPQPLLQPGVRSATTSEGMPPGETNLGRGVIGGSYEPMAYPSLGRGRAGGGGVNMRRAGFAGGGPPYLHDDPAFSYYTPQTGNARGAAYHPPTAPPPPPAIQMQRQLQGQARAKAAVQRGMVRPRVIAQDPTTGVHHDITPKQPFQQPDHPSTMRYPMWPTPPQGSGGGGGPGDKIWPWGPAVRFGSKIPQEFFPPKEQGPESAGQEPRGPGPEGDADWRDPVWKQSEHMTEDPPPRELLPPPGDPRSLVPPGWVRKASPFGRAIDIGRRIFSPSETSGPTGVEAPRTLGRSPSGPRPQSPDSGPVINAPPPQSHVTDLGTWGDESGAPPPRDFSGSPGQFDMSSPRWGGPPPADLDSQIMGWGDEGPQRFRGGRVGRADGGALDTSFGPQQPMDDMSDAQFGRELQDELSHSGDTSWIDQLNTSSMNGGGGFDMTGPDLSHADWEALGGGGGGASPQRIRMNPNAVAATPSFQGGGGGGGGGYRGDVTSLMGGPPITAGHFGPTSGNARGATYFPGSPGGGISPNARAQAPEHPAITTMRHIVRAHDAARARPQTSHVDPNMGPIWQASDTSYGPQLPGEYDEYGYGIGVKPHGGASGSFQGGGGVIGSSPLLNATGSVPQGAGVTGQTSQGGGLGSIATANKAAGGFGDLFGGGERAGFAAGGDAGEDPFLQAIQASVSQGGGGGGRGPPSPPQAPQAPSQGGGGDPTKGLGDSLGKIGSAVKKFTGQDGGVQTQPTGTGPDDTAPGVNPLGLSNSDMSGMNSLSDASFDGLSDADFGFATGGGVGLGSLRGNFSEGGDTDAPADDPAWDKAFTAEVKAAPSNPAAAPAAPAPATGGGTGGVPELIRQSFGDRAGYAGTISRLESGYGSSYVGDGGSSFGPFQLHYGGVNKDMPHPGLGDEFTKETGLDARDPKTVPDQIKFVSDYTAKHGWNDWSTKGQADKIAGGGGANVPSAAATPASAETTSYGGGFQLPGDSGPPVGQIDRHNLQAPTMGDEIRHDPFGYMMTVGSAMMASRSPWLGVGIGEGFEAGNKYLQQQKDLERSWGETQANIANLSAEARLKGADIGLKAQQLQLGALGMKIKLAALRGAGINIDGTSPDGATGGQGGGSGGIGTLPTLGGGAGPSGAPSGSGGQGGAGPTVAAGDAPAAGGAPAGSGAAPSSADSGTVPPDLSKDPDWIRGQQLIAEGNRRKIAGSVAGISDAGADLIAQGNGLVEQAKSKFETSKAPYTAKIDAQKAGYQEYQKSAEDFNRDFESNTQMLDQLGKIYKNYRSGRGGEDIADIQGFASRFGLGGLLPEGWASSGYDAALKTAVDAAFQKMKDSGAGKAPRTALQEALLTSPTPSNDPAANWKIITETQARLHYAKDMMDGVLSGDQLNVAKAESDWANKHKLDGYRTTARKSTPLFMGMTPDSYAQVTGSKLEQTKDGRVFDRDSGKMWDANGNPLN